MKASIGMTPLHILCTVQSFPSCTGDGIRAYLDCCIERKNAAFMIDHKGKTPFDCICEKSLGELLFLENKTFGGVVICWYDHCLDMNMFAEDVDAKTNRKPRVSVMNSSESWHDRWSQKILRYHPSRHLVLSTQIYHRLSLSMQVRRRKRDISKVSYSEYTTLITVTHCKPISLKVRHIERLSKFEIWPCSSQCTEFLLISLQWDLFPDHKFLGGTSIITVVISIK